MRFPLTNIVRPKLKAFKENARPFLGLFAYRAIDAGLWALAGIQWFLVSEGREDPIFPFMLTVVLTATLIVRTLTDLLAAKLGKVKDALIGAYRVEYDTLLNSFHTVVTEATRKGGDE